MGSFNISCAVSNLSINDGDKTGLVLLMPHDRARSDDSERGVDFHTYSYDRFSLVGAPIFGTYGDYGTVVNIERSAAVEQLERFYKLDIDTILSCAGNDNREITDSYSPIYRKFFAYPDLNDYNANLSETLPKIGFTVSGDNYTHSGITVKLDQPKGNQWELTSPAGHKRIIRNVGDVLGFYRNHNIYPGYKLEDLHSINLLLRTSRMTFLQDVEAYMQKALDKSLSDWGRRTVSQEAWEETYLKALPHAGYKEDGTPLTEGEHREYILKQFYYCDDMNIEHGMRDFFASKGRPLYERIVEMGRNVEVFNAGASLVTLMDSLNRMIAPTATGEQCGNDLLNLELNNFTTEILKRRIAEYDDEYEMEEDSVEQDI